MISEETRSALFKYEADPHDRDLRDKSFCNCICSENPDPDFWSNAPTPVWAICGPYYRAALRKGDIIFFIPQKYAIEQTGLQDYIFTGFLVVDSIHTKPSDVRNDSRIDRNYYKKYRRDLNNHMQHDAPRTKRIRAHNFVVGTRDSEWLGLKGPFVRPILCRLGFKPQLKTLDKGRNNCIPRLNTKQATRLRREILSSTPSSTFRAHDHSSVVSPMFHLHKFDSAVVDDTRLLSKLDVLLAEPVDLQLVHKLSIVN